MFRILLLTTFWFMCQNPDNANIPKAGDFHLVWSFQTTPGPVGCTKFSQKNKPLNAPAAGSQALRAGAEGLSLGWLFEEHHFAGFGVAAGAQAVEVDATGEAAAVEALLVGSGMAVFASEERGHALSLQIEDFEADLS